MNTKSTVKCPTCHGTGKHSGYRDSICPDCKGSTVAFPLLALLGTVVGKVQVNKPAERDDRGFECAAWWEKSVSATGMFDVVLVRDYHNRDRFFFTASLPATVVEDNFQSLFCGNRIGDAYDTKKNAGRTTRDIAITKDLVKGCTESSAHGECDQKWAILPHVWQAVVDRLRDQAERYGEYVAYCFAEWKTEGDGKYNAKLTQLGYAGEQLKKCCEGADEVKRSIEFREEHMKRGKNYFEENNPFLKAA